MHEIQPIESGSRGQFVRFCAVGASGYVVNICVFALVLMLGAHHLAAAGVGITAAVAGNFWCNRRWTFRATHGPALRQATRFVGVSVIACAFGVLVLELLGAAQAPALAAQPASVIAALPLSFVANRAWSFARETPDGPAAPTETPTRGSTWLVVADLQRGREPRAVRARGPAPPRLGGQRAPPSDRGRLLA